MKRSTLGALATMLLLGLAAVGEAALCPKCQDLMFTDSVGKCAVCGAQTASAALKICPKCSDAQHKCERCLARLDDSGAKPQAENTPAGKPLTEAPPAEKTSAGKPLTEAPPAEKPQAEKTPVEKTTEEQPPVAPKPIDPTKPGNYTTGKWQYRLDFTDPGTRSEGKWGWLWYDGKKLPRGELNDYYLTPWGPIYWVDVPQTRWGNHGWLTTPAPQSNRKGRVLNTPAAAPAPAPPTPPAAAPAAQPGNWLDIRSDDNGKRARVPLGKNILIRLPGNPTTGYTWQASGVSSAAVRMLGQPQFSAAPATQGKVGAGGTYSFKFQAVQPGAATIKLVYLRPWEKNKPPAQTFTVTLDVLRPQSAPPAKTAGR
jgi:inhibitor of cysteine peptidase